MIQDLYLGDLAPSLMALPWDSAGRYEADGVDMNAVKELLDLAVDDDTYEHRYRDFFCAHLAFWDVELVLGADMPTSRSQLIPQQAPTKRQPYW